jgi:hypothetical protein
MLLNQPTIPAYNVWSTTALRSRTQRKRRRFTSLAYLVTGNDDFMASFSTGPTASILRQARRSRRRQRALVDPASVFARPLLLRVLQGASMATPRLAGSAAVVRWAHRLERRRGGRRS